MRFDDFRALVARMTEAVPPHYLDGVHGVEVNKATVPHPTRGDIYTLGECIPIDTGTDTVQSRIVLYHGSFQALAADRPDFDWREEAWETLTHELRHHLEWRARQGALEAYDWAAEQNFARQEGDRFDPVFHLSGELISGGLYKVDDDFFVDRVVRRLPQSLEVAWHERPYRVTVPDDASLPLFLVLDGLDFAPPGEVILVVRRKPGVLDLFRRAAIPVSRIVRAEPVPSVAHE